MTSMKGKRYLVLSSFFSSKVIRFSISASRFHHLLENNNTTTSQIEDLRIFWLIQDMMTHAAFLSIIAHSFSLLVRYVIFVWHLSSFLMSV